MATKKISGMSAAGALANADLLEIVQSGDTRRSTVGDIALLTKTLAQLNTQISDATLVDTGDSRFSDDRDPNVHDLGGADHGTATLAELSAKVSDATLAAKDVTQTFTGAQNTARTGLSDAATIAVNAALNNAYKVTITAARILGNPTNVVAGMSWTVEVVQGGAGTFALTFASNYVGPASSTGTSPLDTTGDATGKTRLLSCYAASATVIVVVDLGEAF